MTRSLVGDAGHGLVGGAGCGRGGQSWRIGERNSSEGEEKNMRKLPCAHEPTRE